MRIATLYNQNHLLKNSKLAVRNIYILLSLLLVFTGDSNFGLYYIIVNYVYTLYLTKINIFSLFRLYAIPFVFVLFASVSLLIDFNTGHELFTIGKIKIHYNQSSLQVFISTLVRSISVCSIFFLFVLTNTISDVIQIIRYFKIPTLISEMVIITHKFIINIINLASEMHTAQTCRGAYYRQRNMFMSLSFLIGGLFHYTIKNAQYCSFGLSIRNYDNAIEFVGKEKNTTKKQKLIVVSMLFIIINLFIYNQFV